jgi:vacuolar protein sorting-associated protein 13D
MPYACDEPTLLPHITCVAPGGSLATYNMNVVGDGSQLTYENFIYIAMSGTFVKQSSASDSSSYEVESQQLVFDVEGVRVFLARKQTGKRSQLWRMTSTGMLQHEGSSPPQDPRKPTQSPAKSSARQLSRNTLVLDIGGPAVQPNAYVPLMLRKADDRRQMTQRWRFTDDGCLMSAYNGLFVQAKDGFAGLSAAGKSLFSHKC